METIPSPWPKDSMETILNSLLGKYVSLTQNYLNSGLQIKGDLVYNKRSNTYAVSGKDCYFSFYLDEIDPDNTFDGNTIFLKSR